MLYKLNKLHAPPVAAGTRPCIINDLKILAQAVEEKIPFILSEDENTLTKMTNRLTDKGLIAVQVLLLAHGFAPQKLQIFNQEDLPLQ